MCLRTFISDPFFAGELVDQLAAAAPRDWPAVFGSRASRFSPYGTDTNYPLFRSALEDARAREPKPDFILYPGDFLAHHWQSRYEKFASDKGAAGYRAFTTKVVQFFAQEFARYFPGIPVLPTLGNEDSYCGDYQVEPEGAFLRMFAATWGPMLGSMAEGGNGL